MGAYNEGDTEIIASATTAQLRLQIGKQPHRRFTFDLRLFMKGILNEGYTEIIARAKSIMTRKQQLETEIEGIKLGVTIENDSWRYHSDFTVLGAGNSPSCNLWHRHRFRPKCVLKIGASG